MFYKNSMALAISTCLVMSASQVAHTASWKVGDWEYSIGGNINTFYTLTQCDSSDLKAGGSTMAGLACLDADTGAFLDDNAHSVSNGLLPASLNIGAKTTQNGYDISATVNVYYGIASQDTNGFKGDALDFSTVDARQVFLTFGNDKMGTVKAGRDFGLFGIDAILNDMTLLGAGATFTAAGPGHTTLGGLGFGYVYADRLGQINWTSPDMSGFQATVGIFNPLDGQESNGNSTGDGGQPGIHGKLSYSLENKSSKSYFSFSALHQQVQLENGDKPNIQGFDVFGSFSMGSLGLAGGFYSGEGMDSLGIGGIIFPGFDSVTGDAEEVSGYMLQGTYQLGDTKLGLNWSQNEQDKLTKVENSKITVGVYHSLTESLTLVGEISAQESELKNTGTDETTSIAVGAMLFF